MNTQIDSALQVLGAYQSLRDSGQKPHDSMNDRAEIVAHSTLSAFVHHWPSRATDEIRALLDATLEIKTVERSRWMTQRRIAIAKLARVLAPADLQAYDSRI